MFYWKEVLTIMDKTKRLQYLDVSRGLALLFVMIGHNINKESFLYHFVFTFHVPMFFVISGYVYRYKKNSYIKDFWQLAIPYGVVVLLVMISTKIMGGTPYYGSMRDVLRAALFGYVGTHDGVPLMGGIWFFPTLYFARRFMDFIFVTAKKELHRGILVGMVVLVAVGIAKEKIWIPLNIDVAMAAVLFMYVGYLLKEKNFRMNVETAIVALCLWFASLQCENINIGKRDYEMWYVTFLGAIAASVLIMELFRRLEACRPVSFLTGFFAFTGKHTLALLCIHDLDWRIPFPVWGGVLQTKFSSFPNQELLVLLRRITFDYAWLFVFLAFMCVAKKLVKKNDSK